MANIFKRKSPKLKYARQNSSAAWRRYQRSHKRRTAKRRTFARIPTYLLILCISVLLLKGGFYLLEGISAGKDDRGADARPEIEQLNHSDLQKLLDPADFINSGNAVITKQISGRDYTFRTTFDPQLQKSAVSMIDPRWARHIAIVIMEPETGRILAMASHDRTDSMANPCLRADFPAASLFKIITAAAAIETCGFKPDREFAFNGGKYTLYKSQLKSTENRYTNHITLESAFAKSVNPVFGKIGKNYLGKTVLEKYSEDFGFNREINFALPLEKSVATISDDSYNWAEVACGFNKTTRTSPVHAAMLAASVVNNGRMMAPRLVETALINDRPVYRLKPEPFSRPVRPQTARRLKPLMHASVSTGTASGSFSDSAARAIFDDFEIGGKTGSINNNPEQMKYEWFAGYAMQKNTGESIAVSVLVAHEKYIGTRSPEYFRKIVKEYFHSSIKTAGIQQ
ncbi:MAG: PbpA [Desulfobacteraceae bacterium]|nr:PbpA [Desulfobacteraceae bacterium]